MKRISISVTLLLIIFLTGVGALFRLYNLDWGDPFYFHPDERNIASAISQLQFPTQLNPHFFAYGAFPIYLVFFVGLVINLFQHNSVTFQQAIIISRIFSSFLSIALIPSLFFITKHLTGKTSMGIIAAIFATCSVGFIQYAHFGTFEMWLTFLGLWLFYVCIRLIERGNFLYVCWSGMIAGLLLAIKVSSLLLIPLPIFCIVYQVVKEKTSQEMPLFDIAMKLFLYSFFVVVTYVVFNPFVILDLKSFLESMQYETHVATGALPVFYTGEFFTSIPVLFQIVHELPFLLNPFTTVVFILCFFYLTFLALKTKQIHIILADIFFIILFFSQAILFAKWTRYIMPTLPFIYIIICLSFSALITKKILPRTILLVGIFLLLVISASFGMLYTQLTYGTNDTRLQAVTFAKAHIPSNANILSEVYDLGIVPFNSTYPNIKLFNFYDLDNNSVLTNRDLTDMTSFADYLILPSQRILKPRTQNANQFPNGNIFYTNLLANNLEFKKIYETPCDILCKIVYVGDPVWALEETANVFDRPTLYIFKKEK